MIYHWGNINQWYDRISELYGSKDFMDINTRRYFTGLRAACAEVVVRGYCYPPCYEAVDMLYIEVMALTGAQSFPAELQEVMEEWLFDGLPKWLTTYCPPECL